MKKVKYLSLIMIMALMLTGCGGNSEKDGSLDKVEFYSSIKEVYFNPTDGKICTDYENQNSLNENKSGCMKWYAYSENSNGTINMILDHNTTYKVDWSSESDNLNGPKEALEQLKKDTDTWNGVPTRKDSYTNNGIYKEKVDNTTWEEKTRKYTIDYKGYKARFITAKELALINNLEDWDEERNTSLFYFGTQDGYNDYNNRSKFKWLFNYTYGCQDAECDVEETNTRGYWTASAFSKDMAYYVSYKGMVHEENIATTGYKLGIRPVITIDKNLID